MEEERIRGIRPQIVLHRPSPRGPKIALLRGDLTSYVGYLGSSWKVAIPLLTGHPLSILHLFLLLQLLAFCPRASSSRETSSPAANEIYPECFAAISSFSPKMSTKSIMKAINILGLPEGLEILNPIEYQRANNPPPNCLTVYAAQCVSGLRFPLHPFLVELLGALGIPPRLVFIHEKPSSYGAWKSRFFFIRKADWEVPLMWRSSFNELPTINYDLVKERVKAAGLLDHGFKAKALVEKDLLILAGIHPEPDTYTGP
ncbi:hypothetical protein Salat_2427500 [Sesamum alatum]|uniref:Uncharacterized protein n=1 Tax=Sesamum alatum TaxID=300844 RepID=A0AAE1XXZ2_9LAMI|nr:hypothetical protein Salat_2427500 [Sesamum alatum]